MQSIDELSKLLRSCGLHDHSQHLMSMARPKYARALDICFSPSFSIGASGIDEAIGGGMYPGLLYEVVGPAGSGKTQFGLQCILQCLVSLPAPTICAYICADKSVPILRLRSLSSSFAARHSLNFDPLDRIHVHTAHSFRELEGVILTQLPSLPTRSCIPNAPTARVGCVVIDSICGFSRDLDEQWLGPEAAQTRATSLGRMAQALKAFAFDQRCVVVAINQVAVRMRECSCETPSNDHDSNCCHYSGTRDTGLHPEAFSASISFSPSEFPNMSPSTAAAVAQFQPALGATWLHNVNVRVVLARDEANGRVAVIGKSSWLPPANAQFSINDDGLC